jgi:uncharacterized protein YkwD
MKAKAFVALLAATVGIWSVAYRVQKAKTPGAAWQGMEHDARQLAAGAAEGVRAVGEPIEEWAFGSGQSARKHAEKPAQSWAQWLTKSWPGVLKAAAPPAPTTIARYEKMLCDLANRERAARKLPLLKISPGLSAMARAHSREMAQKGFFAHESPTRGLRTPADRYRARFKRAPRLVAENIYKLEGPDFYTLKPDDFRRAHKGWMDSPGHRANILRTSPAGGPTHMGVGIIVRNGSFWATQNFARPQ